MGGTLVPTVFPAVLNPPASGKDKTMSPGKCVFQHCASCSNHASTERACGQFYCPSCVGCGDDIIARFNHKTGEWETITEDTLGISHVKVTVEGPADDVAEVVEAIDERMEEKFALLMSKRIVRSDDETPA